MAHLTVSVEYGIHCLLWLVDAGEHGPSSRDLAELQGISPTFLAKIFPKLEKAGLVQSSGGVQGGYRLSRHPDEITLLQIVDAIEGDKPLFDCRQVRSRCSMYADDPPKWATDGICAIHAAMIRAEDAMRTSLSESTLGSVAAIYHAKAPAQFLDEVGGWFEERLRNRRVRTSSTPG